MSALAVRENVVRLTFTEAVNLSGILDPQDGKVASRYSVVNLPETIGLDGLLARPVRVVEVEAGPLATQVDLWLDRPLSPYPAQYTAQAVGLFNVDGDALLPTSPRQFDGLYRGLVPPSVDLAVPSRDIANPQSFAGVIDPLPVTTDPRVLGTFPTDETGDVAFDEGLASYKKRVFRRLSTRRGSFLHLPDYGVTVLDHVKQLARIGMVQHLAAEAEEQIRQEPETKDCRVRIVQDGGTTYYLIAVKTAAGRSLSLRHPIAPQSGV